MTIQDAFNEVFKKSISQLEFEINSSDNYSDIEHINNDFARLVFINNMINFFATKYDHDMLDDYFDYMNHFNKYLESRICQFISEDSL